MLDYLDDLARGRCGKSVPGSIAATLSFFEKAGGISMSKRISGLREFTPMLDYLDNLSRGKGGKSIPGDIAATLSFSSDSSTCEVVID